MHSQLTTFMHFGNSTSICHPLNAFLFSFPATICLSVAILSVDCHNWIVVHNGLSSHERRSSVYPKDEREDLSVRKKAGLEWFGHVLKRIFQCLSKRASLALVPVRACIGSKLPVLSPEGLSPVFFRKLIIDVRPILFFHHRFRNKRNQFRFRFRRPTQRLKHGFGL